MDGKWDLAAYQISTSMPFMIVTTAGDQEYPSVAHGLLAYQTRYANSQLDVGVLVLADKTSFLVSDVPSAQINPAVGDGVVVWEDTRDHQSDIYRFDWTGVVPPGRHLLLTCPWAPGRRLVSNQHDRSEVDGFQRR